MADDREFGAAIAKMMRGDESTELAEPVVELDVLDDNPNGAAMLRYLTEGKQARDAALVGAVHGVDSEPISEAEVEVDFDGGVREPAPPPSDPHADHHELLAELLGAPRRPDGFWEDG